MDNKKLHSESLENLVYQRYQSDCSAADKKELDDLISSADQASVNTIEDVMQSLSDLKSSTPEPTDALVNRTLDSVMHLRQQEQNITLVELQSQAPVSRPTFSFKELIAIAACLLLSIGLLLPAFQRATQAANREKCAALQGQMGVALRSYALENMGSLPNSSAKNINWLTSGKKGTEPVSNSRNLYKLIDEKFVPNPQIFLCPAVGGVSFNPHKNQTDFEDANYIHYSYTFNSADDKIRINDSPQASKRIILADSSPIMKLGAQANIDASNFISNNHSKSGQNILMLDGHTNWQAATNANFGDNIFQAGTIKNYKGNEKPATKDDTFLLPAWTKNALLNAK